MKKIMDFFKVHFLFGDTLLTAVCFYLFFGIFKKLGMSYLDLLIFDNADQLYPVFLNSCITLLGFLLTGISIIMIFLKDDKLAPLKEHGHFTSILNIYFSATRVCALVTVISFCGLVAEKTIIMSHITALMACVLIVRLARCIWIIEQITTILYRKNQS